MSDGDRGERDQTLNHGLGVLAAVILVALFVGVLSYSSGIEGERRNQYPAAYAESAKRDAAKTCIGTDPAAVFECAYERVEASHDQARAEQDLDAQQGMRFWAAVMAAIALGTLAVTIVGVWYVKRTLETNVGFLRESEGATRAMVRQNELAAIAQRPWVILEVTITKIKVEGNALQIWTRVDAQNIGKSVAQDAALWATVVQGRSNLAAAIEKVREWLDGPAAFRSPLVPGDRKQHWNQPNWSINHLNKDAETGRAEIFVFAGARYRVPGDPEIKVTERAFSICQSEDADPFAPHGLIYPPDVWLSADELCIHPAGHTRAT